MRFPLPNAGVLNSIGQLPPSMLTRPGANVPNTTSDANSTGIQTGVGYGAGNGYPQASNPYLNYVNSLPGVISANMANTFQGGAADTQLRGALEGLATNFGDASAFGGGGVNLAKLLGRNVDPATAALAHANTIGPGGQIGNSVVAQLYLAARNARNSSLGALAGAGFNHSGQVGYDLNRIQQGYSHNLYQAGQDLSQQAGNAINQNVNTHNQLTEGVTNAVLRGYGQVVAHPTQYPVGTPQTLPKATTTAAPKIQQGGPSMAFKPLP